MKPQAARSFTKASECMASPVAWPAHHKCEGMTTKWLSVGSALVWCFRIEKKWKMYAASVIQ